MSVQGVPRNQCEVLRINLRGQGWTSRVCRFFDYRYVEKVLESIRQKWRLSSYELDEKTNVLIWGLCVSTTMKASVHLGHYYNENLVACKNTNFKDLKTLFDITQRLILEQSVEILNVSTMIWRFTPWMRSTFVS